MANGNYTNAYATVQPTGFDGQEWLHKEQKRQEEIDAIAAAKKKAKEDAFKGDVKFTATITPYEAEDTNSAATKIYLANANKFNELANTMAKYRDNPNSPEYIKAKLAADRINTNLANQVKLAGESWNKASLLASDPNSLLTGSQKNRHLSFLTKDWKIAVDDNGETLFQLDSNKDGVIGDTEDSKETFSLSEFSDQYVLGNVRKKADINDIVTKTVVGDVEIEKRINSLREDTTVNAWEDNVVPNGANVFTSLKDITTNSFSNLIFDENGKLNDLGVNIAGTMGIWDYNGNIPEGKEKEVLNKLVDMKRAQLGFKTGVNQDQPKSSGGGSGSGNNKIKYTINPTPTRSTFGEWKNDILETQVNAVALSFKDDKKGDLTLTTKFGRKVQVSDVTNITLNKYGAYVASVEVTDDKGGAVDRLEIAKQLMAKRKAEGKKGKPTDAEVNQAVAEAKNSAPKTTRIEVIELDPDQANLIAARAEIPFQELNDAIMKEGYSVPKYIKPNKGGNPKLSTPRRSGNANNNAILD
jgi:hypothetical protein